MTKTADIAESIRHPDHDWMFQYWRGKAPKGGGLPSRQDIDPIDFPRLLPRIALIEVLREGGLNFRYRLAGTEIVDRAGRDPTGKRFDELYEGSYLTTAIETYRRIADHGEPYLSERTFPLVAGREFLRYDRLILPLASDGRTVDMLLLLIVVLAQNRVED